MTVTECDIEAKAKKILEIITEDLCIVNQTCEVRHEPAVNAFAVTVVAKGKVTFSSYFLRCATKRICKEVDSDVTNIVVSVLPGSTEFTVYVI